MLQPKNTLSKHIGNIQNHSNHMYAMRVKRVKTLFVIGVACAKTLFIFVMRLRRFEIIFM